jgi:hypothetical protein
MSVIRSWREAPASQRVSRFWAMLRRASVLARWQGSSSLEYSQVRMVSWSLRAGPDRPRTQPGRFRDHEAVSWALISLS